MDPSEVREERVVTNTGTNPPAEVPATTPTTPTTPVAAAAPASTTTTSSYRRSGESQGVYRTVQLVWLIVGVIDLLIALDFIFRAAAANNTGFAHYMYRIGGRLAAPFDGIFNLTVVNGKSVLRWPDLLAIAIYTIAAYIVVKLVRIFAAPK
jgi:hypothetical protein